MMAMVEAGEPAEVLRLVRLALDDPAAAAQLPAAKLDLLLQLLRHVRLHGRFAADLKKTGAFDELPLIAQQQLESIFHYGAARERQALWELNRIAWATAERPDFDLVLMKGCAYMLLGLPNAAGRIFADVDLIAPEEQLPEIESLLNHRGWKTRELSPHDDNYYRAWSHELPPIVHPERGVEVDVHHNILPRTARLKPPAAKLLENARPVDDARYRVLGNEDLVLHAMVHLMVDSDLALKLRDLVDIDVMCRHFEATDPGFWERLTSRADELGVGRPCYYSLRFMSRLLGTPVPAETLRQAKRWEPPAPARRLMDGLVPLAILPEHPLHLSRRAGLARLLLYMRSHWLRMPPWLLSYHLSYKFFATRLARHRDPA
jgi:hypothetical protein